ncbi:MAG: hypothetical protein J5802_12265 [Butyrivibrio sp.]|nr:hypothetical protein [Butyrivibrio sp.]
MVRSFILCGSSDIWYDELFSMEFSGSEVGELIGLTAKDVHPPLYYILVRGVTLLFKSLGLAGAGKLSIVSVAKITSIIPFVFIMVYSLTAIRKIFSFATSGIFSFAVVTMPGLPEYTTEIRMYSFALFFVTAALIHAYNLYASMIKKTDGKWDYLNSTALFAYSAAAAYTHYYAAMAVGIIYIMLMTTMISTFVKVLKLKKAGASEVSVKYRPFVLAINAGNFTVITYIFWVSSLFSQMTAVKGNYWIQPVGPRTVLSCMKYMFLGYFTNTKFGMILAILIILLIVGSKALPVANIILKKEEADLNLKFELLAITVLPIVVLMGIIASMIFRPVFVSRYMVPSYGVFWLSVAAGIGRKLKEKPGKNMICTALLLALILVVGCVDFKAFIGNEEYRQVNMKKTEELFASIDKDTVIISNFDHVQALLSYYLNEKADAASHAGADKVDYRIYLYEAEAEPLIAKTVPGLDTVKDPAQIRDLLDAGKKVLFLGSFNSREVLIDEWNKEYGITSENKGSYLMERYWFDVFELGL